VRSLSPIPLQAPLPCLRFMRRLIPYELPLLPTKGFSSSEFLRNNPEPRFPPIYLRALGPYSTREVIEDCSEEAFLFKEAWYDGGPRQLNPILSLFLTSFRDSPSSSRLATDQTNFYFFGEWLPWCRQAALLYVPKAKERPERIMIPDFASAIGSTHPFTIS